VIGGSEGNLYLVKDLNLEQLVLLNKFSSPIVALKYVPGNQHVQQQRVLACAQEESFLFSEIQSLKNKSFKNGHDGVVNAFDLCKQNRFLVSSGCDGFVVVIDCNIGFAVLKKEKVFQKSVLNPEKQMQVKW